MGSRGISLKSKSDPSKPGSLGCIEKFFLRISKFQSTELVSMVTKTLFPKFYPNRFDRILPPLVFVSKKQPFLDTIIRFLLIIFPFLDGIR